MGGFLAFVFWLFFGWVFGIMAAKSQDHIAVLVFWGIFAAWVLTLLALLFSAIAEDDLDMPHASHRQAKRAKKEKDYYTDYDYI